MPYLKFERSMKRSTMIISESAPHASTTREGSTGSESVAPNSSRPMRTQRDQREEADQLVAVERVPARLGVAARAEPVEEERDEKDERAAACEPAARGHGCRVEGSLAHGMPPGRCEAGGTTTHVALSFRHPRFLRAGGKCSSNLLPFALRCGTPPGRTGRGTDRPQEHGGEGSEWPYTLRGRPRRLAPVRARSWRQARAGQASTAASTAATASSRSASCPRARCATARTGRRRAGARSRRALLTKDALPERR